MEENEPNNRRKERENRENEIQREREREREISQKRKRVALLLGEESEEKIYMNYLGSSSCTKSVSENFLSSLLSLYLSLQILPIQIREKLLQREREEGKIDWKKEESIQRQ